MWKFLHPSPYPPILYLDRHFQLFEVKYLNLTLSKSESAYWGPVKSIMFLKLGFWIFAWWEKVPSVISWKQIIGQQFDFLTECHWETSNTFKAQSHFFPTFPRVWVFNRNCNRRLKLRAIPTSVAGWDLMPTPASFLIGWHFLHSYLSLAADNYEFKNPWKRENS